MLSGLGYFVFALRACQFAEAGRVIHTNKSGKSASRACPLLKTRIARECSGGVLLTQFATQSVKSSRTMLFGPDEKRRGFRKLIR